MFTYCVICTLLVLLLLRLNYDALKRLKGFKHNGHNLKQTVLAKEELWQKNFEQKVMIMRLEIRVEQYSKQLKLQQEINLKLVTRYNNLRESIIDVIELNSQLINLIVSGEDKKLRVA